MVTPLPPGTRVGPFSIVRLLARGGMAEVYRADAGLEQDAVALKLLRAEYAHSRDWREMFLDEARTAGALTTHPHLVPVRATDEWQGRPYLVMDYVAGLTLHDVVRGLEEAGVRLDDAAVLAVGVAACRALEAVHEQALPGRVRRPIALVHRDVSPHNLLLTPDGTLKLIDFGVAQAITNRNVTLPGTTKGNPGYFSPEQAQGRRLDGRSDLFSLGATLYALCAGAPPLAAFPGPLERARALLGGRWPTLRELSPGRAPGLYAALERALALDPAQRFPHARAMGRALEGVALDEGLPRGAAALAGWVRAVGDGFEAAVPKRWELALG